MEMEMEMEMEMKEVGKVREYFESGKTKEVSWRRSQLKALLSFVKEREDDIFTALKQDLGKHPAESYRDELGVLVKDISAALDNLENWMSAKKAKLPVVAFPTTAKVVPEPLGVVLIISSWNLPFGLTLEPLVGAIAAGNAVVLKPSELSPSCSSVLADGISSYLDSNAFRVFQGGPDVSQTLLKLKWDSIFFTGSREVGKIVMTAAAKHLTPVTLELGGKCPAIVDSLESLAKRARTMALRRIVSAKFGACCGQVCVGIDYILTQEIYAQRMVEFLKGTIKEMFGYTPNENGSITRIVNKHHFMRLKQLLDDPGVKASIVYGGSMDEKTLYIEPTILVDPPLDAKIMTEEIFGPLLPIITLKHIEESIDFLKSRPKPLAIYCFTKNDGLMRKLQSETSSGSIMFNDTILQYAAETLPFGGVGECGIGRYHGKYTFDTFSHEKVVVKRNYLVDFWFRYPPWNAYKLELFRLFYAFDYPKLLLTILGLRKPPPLPDNI